MAAFIEQEGVLSSPTLADELGCTVRTKGEARQIRFHATVLFGAGGEWAVELVDGPPLSGLYCVRAEPDAMPQSATARTFADPLSGLPTLAVELAPYHPPIALHLALLVEYDEDLFATTFDADAPPLVYRLYPPPTMVMSPRSIALQEEAVAAGRSAFATWPWPKSSQMSVDGTSLPSLPHAHPMVPAVSM